MPIKFLFKNLGIRQTIIKNTFWLASAEGIARFFKLILIIYVARILGATEYGKFTFALNFVSLFVILSDFGLSAITTRELSQEKEKEKEFSALLSLKIILSIIALFFILIGSFFVTSDLSIQKIIWILSIYILFSSFSDIIFAFLRARQKMEYEALTKILQALLITGVGLFVIFKIPSVKNLSYSYLFVSFVTLISILVFFHFKIASLKFSWKKSIWRNFLSLSWPLGIGALLTAICVNINSIIMGYLGLITEVGWYNAAFKIINIVVIPSLLISQSFYPALNKAFKESKDAFQKIWDYQLEIRVFFITPIIVGGIILAPKIIDFIYGSGFVPSVFVLQILLVMGGLAYFSIIFYQALIILNQQKKTLWIGFFGVIVDIVLSIILIIKFSLYGAVLASIITYFLIFFLLFIFTSKFISIKIFDLRIFSSVFGAILSSIPMYFIISQKNIYHLNIFLIILIGVLIYSVVLFIYRKMLKIFSSVSNS